MNSLWAPKCTLFDTDLLKKMIILIHFSRMMKIMLKNDYSL